MKICIDAGHGGTDSGAVGIGGRFEKTDVLRFANALAAKCKAAGIQVVQTRTGDTYPSLEARAQLANATGCNYFVSIHRNLYWLASANGIECLVPKTKVVTAAIDGSKRLAAAIQKKMLAVGGRDRTSEVGYKLQNATVLCKTDMPATTVEILFVTNAADNLLFDMKFDQYVQAVYDGIIEASGFKPVVNDLTYSAIKDTLFITGASVVKQGETVELLAYPMKTADLNSKTVARARINGKDGIIIYGDFKKGE